MFIRFPLGLTMLVSWFSASPAMAAETSCLRDSECSGSAVCLAGTCGTGAVAPDVCIADDDCSRSSAQACVDGFCKSEHVVCRNPAGACWVGESSGECECLDGNGAGWSDGFNPDDPAPVPTDAELADQCAATLVETCGEEAPQLSEACTGTVHTECEALLEKLVMFAALCGESVEPTLAALNECCEHFEDPEFVTRRECTFATTPTTCDEAYETCGDGSGVPAGSNDGEGNQEQAPGEGGDVAVDRDSEEDAEASSCAVTPKRGGSSWMWCLAAFAFLGRIRRSAAHRR